MSDGIGSGKSVVKVETYRLEYSAEPKEPTQFGSASGSEIQHLPFSHTGIVSLYRAEPKEPTESGSVSGSEIQNLPFSLRGIVSLYRAEPREPTESGSVSGLEIQNLCIGRNLVSWLENEKNTFILPLLHS